jgi:DNA replication and repair protein RecF
LIILDLAAISVYHSWHNEFPLFLLDDVDAELDKRRVNHLLEYLEGRTQTFVTTSKESLVEQYAARATVFEVKEGVAAQISAPRGETSTLSKGSSGI